MSLSAKPPSPPQLNVPPAKRRRVDPSAPAHGQVNPASQPLQPLQPPDTNIQYSLCQVTETLMVPIQNIGLNLAQTLQTMLAAENENKCNQYGFIKPGSTKVMAFSNPECRGNVCTVEVLYSCSAFYPVAGMNLKCTATSISKAGIMATSADDTPSPFQLIVARDHSVDDDDERFQVFQSIKKGDTFVAQVIGSRFELNDPHVTIIGKAISTASSL